MKKKRRKAIESSKTSLTMYYAAMDRDVPGWAKTLLIGALGYFIRTLGSFRNAIPEEGDADDADAIAATLSMVAAHIKPEHKKQAKHQADEWFS